MSDELSRTEGSRSKWFAKRLAAVILAVLGVLAVVRLLTPTKPTSEPTSGGKPVSKWFDEALSLDAQAFPTSACANAFSEMGGDAVPYLARWVEVQPSPFTKFYDEAVDLLPSAVTGALPLSAADYQHRRITALGLLQRIGREQRWKLDAGEQVAKPSIARAVPAIQTALRDPNELVRAFAVQAAWIIGPPAAATLPDLIRFAQNSNDVAAASAIQAFGEMGPLASNAVPILVQIATNASRGARMEAIQSLGGIGDAARAAVPALTTLLANEKLRVFAARSLAEIGFIPEAAVPALREMKQSADQWAATVACLALWSRDRQNPQLRAELVAAFHSEYRGGLVCSLGRMGTNAQSFAPEIKSLIEDTNVWIRAEAKRALRRIQSVFP